MERKIQINQVAVRPLTLLSQCFGCELLRLMFVLALLFYGPSVLTVAAFDWRELEQSHDHMMVLGILKDIFC